MTRTRVGAPALIGVIALLIVSFVVALLVGAADLTARDVLAAVLERFPGSSVMSGLTERQLAIVWQLRMPRAIVAAGVGGMLAMAGAGYQGVFRNPLADPYLLGAAAGGGLGATLAILGGAAAPVVAVAAFVGATGAVGAAWLVAGGALGRVDTRTLLLAGIAVGSFLTAVQTYLLQRAGDRLREVFTWILGRLSAATWDDVRALALPAVIAGAVLVASRRWLDVLSVGDEEAASLGARPDIVRAVVVAAASLATAAAVAVSGLIGFVGLVVPHGVRLVFGPSYRRIVPLSALVGAAFLLLADSAARVLVRPGEVPVGVVTALVGAPVFAVLLRRGSGR